MKKWIFVVVLWFLGFSLIAQKPFDLQTGDILFQTNKARTSFVKAIENVTLSLDNLDFSHVGVAYWEDGEIYILEAVPPKVSKTPLEKYLKQSKWVDGNPVVVVERLKRRYRKCIPEAIEKMKSLIGKPYDYVFSPDNDDYYCSEIIWLAFRKKNGQPIFDARPMSFKDKVTGETNPYWIEHFEKHHVPVPEGVPGTSPGDMSRSRTLQVVHRYF